MNQTQFTDWLLDSEQNLEVYRGFVELAKDAKARGWEHWAAKGVIEVLRWQTRLRTNDPQFKINNNLAPAMARRAMKKNPDLAGFFRTRQADGD